jgi:hypothetical protein
MANDLFLELEQKYRLPAGFLARTYQIESGSGANLYNPLSKAAGGFQFIPSTAKQYGLKDPYDLAQSAEAAAKLAADNRAALQKAGIEEPTASQLYLAHQQGAGGATKLLTGVDKKATDLVGKNAVTWNAGNQAMTGYEFANKIMSKFEGGGQAAAPSAAAPAGATPPWQSPIGALGDLDQKYLNGGLSFLASPITGLLGGGSPQPPQATPMPGQRMPDILAQVAGGDTRLEPAGITPATAKELAGLSSLGNALMAAGAPKGPPPMLAGVTHRPKVKDDLFAGLFGYMG